MTSEAGGGIGGRLQSYAGLDGDIYLRGGGGPVATGVLNTGAALQTGRGGPSDRCSPVGHLLDTRHRVVAQRRCGPSGRLQRREQGTYRRWACTRRPGADRPGSLPTPPAGLLLNLFTVMHRVPVIPDIRD
jgi:hypothetical protein